MKKVLIGWICSIIGILLGGFILCFPQFIPFGATLIGVSGVSFISLGVLAVFIKAGAL